MLVFQLKTEFRPEMTSNHYRFPFEIKEKGKAMRILYRYSPKEFADRAESLKLVEACYARYGFAVSPEKALSELPLNNLITLSVDSPSGLAGTAHRHASLAEYTVSEESVSPGFARKAIVPGEWALVFSTHAVLSDRVVAEAEVYVD